MSRIKGRYVAQVVIEFDVPRDDDTYPLEEVRNSICGGELTEAIKRVLSGGIAEVTTTVNQQYADVYEVDDDGTEQ